MRLLMCSVALVAATAVHAQDTNLALFGRDPGDSKA